MNTNLVITEATWQEKVLDLAQLYRWRWIHLRPALTSKGWRTPYSGHNGFPDLCLVKGPRLVVAELKTEAGRLTTDQSSWLEAFEQVPGAEVYTWRPSDWPTVLACLAKESQP